ncbi:TetR/AcrR family transcriptional regulator [Streptomyces sp. NPDC051776]|uniref:TetR/AcrR family transcriptional regulator n=1 Tax=Streptomyces sp. NPDC051776 TaxID=3155414 RepID=UPI00343566ED
MESHAPAVPPVGRRERNKQRVKERLYTAALELFRERGYDQTSIDDIAERADVARGTFFNYFPRKEDLIGSWSERRRAKLITQLAETKSYGSGAITQLRQCMFALGRINEQERELTVAMLTAWVKAGRPIQEEPYMADIFAGIIRAGCQSGELADGLSPDLMGGMLRDLYLGSLYRWSRKGPEQEPGALSAELLTIIDHLLAGVGKQPVRS